MEEPCKLPCPLHSRYTAGVSCRRNPQPLGRVTQEVLSQMGINAVQMVDAHHIIWLSRGKRLTNSQGDIRDGPRMQVDAWKTILANTSVTQANLPDTDKSVLVSLH